MKTTSNKSGFEEFLRARGGAKKSKPIDWQGEKKLWLDSLDGLYSKIRTWLAGYAGDSLLTMRKRQVKITEDHLGTYDAAVLEIRVAGEVISLVPRGTLLVGSRGRVDIIGPKSQEMLVEPEWDTWLIARLEGTRWSKQPLDKDSFELILRQVIEG